MYTELATVLTKKIIKVKQLILKTNYNNRLEYFMINESGTLRTGKT